MDEGGSRNGTFLSEELSVDSLEGGLLYWVPCAMKGSLWGWASLFMGA